MITLVFAGNYAQYKQWLGHRSERQFRYVDSRQAMLGYSEVAIMKIGTYLDHPEWRNMEREIMHLEAAGRVIEIDPA